MNRRIKILVMGLDLLVIGILSFLLLNMITIPLISPDNKSYTPDRRPLFAWGGVQGEYVILVDDNAQFTSPLAAKVTGNSYILDDDLEFGTYYWKVMSDPVSSGTGKFTIVSSVIVSRDEREAKNEGNTEVLLTAPSITGAFVLAVNESVEIGAEENVKAEQA